MTSAMELIESKTLTASASSIEFINIPQDGTDLVFLFNLRLDTANGGLRIKVNGSTANLSTRFLYGNGSSPFTGTDTTYIGTVNNSNQTANTFGNGGLYIPNYANTSSAKSFSADIIDENNATTAIQWITAGLFNSTTAISSLEFFGDAAGNFVAGSIISLYKVTKGTDGIVTTS
jgi:hypothetical protein